MALTPLLCTKDTSIKKLHTARYSQIAKEVHSPAFTQSSTGVQPIIFFSAPTALIHCPCHGPDLLLPSSLRSFVYPDANHHHARANETMEKKPCLHGKFPQVKDASLAIVGSIELPTCIDSGCNNAFCFGRLKITRTAGP